MCDDSPPAPGDGLDRRVPSPILSPAEREALGPCPVCGNIVEAPSLPEGWTVAKNGDTWEARGPHGAFATIWDSNGDIYAYRCPPTVLDSLRFRRDHG